MPNLVLIGSRVFVLQAVKVSIFASGSHTAHTTGSALSCKTVIYPFLDSSTSPQVEPLDRSLRLMAQTTCCRVRKYPLEENLTKIIRWGVADPLNRKILSPR